MIEFINPDYRILPKYTTRDRRTDDDDLIINLNGVRICSIM